MELVGKIGPQKVEGTLTAEDRQAIFDKTKCSASVRGRQNTERALTVSGPVKKLEEAHKLAMDAILKNKSHVEGGQALPKAGGEFKGSQERKEAGEKRRTTWEEKKTTLPQPHHGGSGSAHWNASPADYWAWDGWQWVASSWLQQTATPWQWMSQWAAAPQQAAAAAAPKRMEEAAAARLQPAAAAVKQEPASSSSYSSTSSESPTPKAQAKKTRFADQDSVDWGSSSEEEKEEERKNKDSKAKEMQQNVLDKEKEAKENEKEKEKDKAKEKEKEKESASRDKGEDLQEQVVKEEEEEVNPKRSRVDQQQLKPLLLVPNWLKGKTIHMFTVGCQGQRRMEEELDAAGLNKQSCLLLDCRAFQGARLGVGNHYGKSTRVISNILSIDQKELKAVFKFISTSLQCVKSIDTLVFYCDHGKHRSVGVESLTANAMALCTNAWAIKPTVHLMRMYWSRKKCGWAKCAECDLHNDQKEGAFVAAAELFKEQWVGVCKDP